MDLTPQIRKALRVAATLHDGQHRRNSPVPVIVHPFEVAMVVSEYTKDEDIISSAFLHDVLEDTQGYSYEKMVEDFGSRVSDIVKSLTDEPLPEELTWDEKHQKYLETLKNSSDEAVLVCLADKFANVSHDQLNLDRVWYYQGVIDIAKVRQLTKNTKLLDDFKGLLEKK